MFKNQRFSKWALSATAAFCLTLPAALAKTQHTTTTTTTTTENPPTNPTESVTQSFAGMPDVQNQVLSTDNTMPTEQTYQTAQTQTQQTTNEQAGQVSETAAPSNPEALKTDIKKQDVKTELAPHAVVIEGSLATALDQLHGIRNQLDVAAGETPSADTISRLRADSKKVKTELKTAQKHQTMLHKAATKDFPQIASSDQYQSARTSYSELNSATKQWAAAAAKPDYFKDTEQAKMDLDQFEAKLKDGIAKTKSLSSDKFNVRIG